MGILIGLLVLFFIGYFIAKRSDDFELFGVVIAIVSGMYLVFHIFAWSTATYTYNTWVIERESFVETLAESRKNGSPIELASITQNITAWNQSLAVNKYDNTTFFLDDYIDDRVVTLKPIK